MAQSSPFPMPVFAGDTNTPVPAPVFAGSTTMPAPAPSAHAPFVPAPVPVPTNPAPPPAHASSHEPSATPAPTGPVAPFDARALEPAIYAILSAPSVDLSTISAKRVRKTLRERDAALDEPIRAHREAVDAVIGEVYGRVSAAAAAAAANAAAAAASVVTKQEEGSEAGSKRKRGSDAGEGEEEFAGDDGEDGEDGEDEGEGEEEEEQKPPKKKQAKAKSKSKSKLEQSDAELARKLSSQLNARSTRHSSTSAARTGAANGGAKKRASAKRAARAKKSAATVDDSDEDGENGGEGGGTKKKRKAGKSGGAKGGFAKEYTLSEPLSVLVDAPKLSRPKVVSKLWEYIKAHELQNASNRREILCDPAMRAVFACDKIDMFTMNKKLGQHLHEDQ